MKRPMSALVAEWIRTFFLAGLLAMVITTFIRPTLVRGDSMTPTFYEDDYLIVHRRAYRDHGPDRGDLVVFSTRLADPSGQSKHLVKRVIALSGDHLVIEGGQVRLNGKILEETYLGKNAYTYGQLDLTIEKGKLFVMGDNRLNSLDSRNPLVGPIDDDQLLGRVVFKVFPLEGWGPLE